MSVNSALLSRLQILELQRLSSNDLLQVMQQACREFAVALEAFLDPTGVETVIRVADGDARKCLLTMEHLWGTWNRQTALNQALVENELGAVYLRFDQKGDQHYSVISAFIKSIRGSDADAGLYYLARMILGGEDPSFIARRLVILASEDIGNADPRALPLAVACAHAVEMIGLPEAELNLAQTVTFLASCPKSNASYQAWNHAKAFAESQGSLPVPDHLRSKSPAYRYPHDFPKHFVSQDYLPKNVALEKPFYQPSDQGFEKNLREYVAWLKQETK